MMEAVNTSETLVNFYYTAQRNIAEDSYRLWVVRSVSGNQHVSLQSVPRDSFNYEVRTERTKFIIFYGRMEYATATSNKNVQSYKRGALQDNSTAKPSSQVVIRTQQQQR
jgi:hypothetical protein